MKNSRILESCRNCGNDHSERLYCAGDFDHQHNEQKNEYELRRCYECGLVNTIGVSTNQLEEAYSIDYYGSPQQKFNSAFENLLQGLNHLRAKEMLKKWRNQSDNNSAPMVLDIGCGRGQLLQAFHSYGARISGIERAGFEVDDLSSRFIHIGSLTDREFEGRQFDIVVIWHALEHLDDFREFFPEVRKHLSKRGYLLVAVPNFSSLQSNMFGARWFHLDLPRHLMHFEANWLETNLNNNGFRVESISHFDLVQNSYGFIQSCLNVLFPSRPNEYYQMLKFNAGKKSKFGIRFWVYTLISLILTPIALIECLLSVFFKRGATIQISATISEQ